MEKNNIKNNFPPEPLKKLLASKRIPLFHGKIPFKLLEDEKPVIKIDGIKVSINEQNVRPSTTIFLSTARLVTSSFEGSFEILFEDDFFHVESSGCELHLKNRKHTVSLFFVNEKQARIFEKLIRTIKLGKFIKEDQHTLVLSDTGFRSLLSLVGPGLAEIPPVKPGFIKETVSRLAAGEDVDEISLNYHVALEFALSDSPDYRRALFHFERAINLTEKEKRTGIAEKLYIAAAACQILSGDYRGALMKLKPFLKKRTASAPLFFLAGEIFSKLSKNISSFLAFSETLSRKDFDKIDRNYLITCLNEKLPAASSVFQKISRKNNSGLFKQLSFSLATVSMWLGNNRAALFYLEKNNTQEALFMKATIFLSLGIYSKCIELISPSEENYLSRPDLLLKLLADLKKCGDPVITSRILEKLIRAFPGSNSILKEYCLAKEKALQLPFHVKLFTL